MTGRRCVLESALFRHSAGGRWAHAGTGAGGSERGAPAPHHVTAGDGKNKVQRGTDRENSGVAGYSGLQWLLPVSACLIGGAWVVRAAAETVGRRRGRLSLALAVAVDGTPVALDALSAGVARAAVGDGAHPALAPGLVD